jgi:acyl-CoA synthetase (AMP-forming)/AMP-acid ligase II
VPVGTPGELHIGGIGLGRGYLNRRSDCGKVHSQPVRQEGGRLYKTGDLVRYRADGNIDYLGRIDHQVKIRIQDRARQIEARLLEHPDIKEAVVLAREDQPGDKRLVAYLVTQNGSELSVTDLRVNLLQAGRLHGARLLCCCLNYRCRPTASVDGHCRRPTRFVASRPYEARRSGGNRDCRDMAKAVGHGTDRTAR